MNNDRFLTRVFDKQEKKMLYVGDYIKAGDRYIQTKDCAVLKGFTVGGMITTDGDNIWFGDRFVPMMCSGFKKDYKEGKKLVYESDIVKSYYGKSFLVEFEHGCLKLKALVGEYEDDIGSLYNGFEIIGNRWEQPELMEVKECIL